MDEKQFKIKAIASAYRRRVGGSRRSAGEGARNGADANGVRDASTLADHGQLITAQFLVNSASRNTHQTPISGAAKTGMAEISDNSDRPTPVAEDRPRLQ